MKQCQHCRTHKGLDAFHKNRRMSDGLDHWCKACRSEYYLANKGKYRARASTPAARATKELCRKKYDKKYPGETNRQKKEWADRNREKVRETHRNYNRRNKQKIKNWGKENIVRLREYRRLYQARRWRDDRHYRMRSCLASRIHHALRGTRKSSCTEQLLGCSIRNFLTYFESKFVNGMTWANVMNGKIHVDHIIPCASFDLAKVEDQKKCFHFSNLQPLWAKDNRKKSDKIQYVRTSINNAPTEVMVGA